ncbi:glutamate receptor 2.8-like [Fagus crenata]
MATFPTFTFLALVLLLAQKATVYGSTNNTLGKDHVKGIIGAILDSSSRIGKEQKVAMEMAIKDVFDKTNQSFDLQIKNSQREPVQATIAAWDLIKKQQAQAILGPHTWEKGSLVAEIGNQAQIPVFSLADSTPHWATKQWPFLLQASQNHNAQMKAIAAIVQSWEWHQVTVIYEDIDSLRSGVIHHLSVALQQIGVEISHRVPLSPFASSSSLSKELETLKGEQCRVYVVHLSFSLAVRLFEKAKEMNMIEKGYVWITTEPFSNLIHSLNASSLSSMQGIIGLKSYFPQNNPNFQNFSTRFHEKFSLENPEEDKHEPGIYAAQAYDAVQTICLAMRETSNGSQQFLQNIRKTKFNGVSGNVQFLERKVAPTHIFQIINVVEKSYKELGFWSNTKGFSMTTNESGRNNTSMRSLEQVYWPGGAWTAPRGWTFPINASPLRIGVPTKASFKKFVNVKFDAVVGDVAIVAKRYRHAEFTIPYTESGLVMIVPVRPQTSNRGWLFVKPFTKAMWALIGAIIVYNGFVVWLIERNHCPVLRGSPLNQIGALLCLGFTTLFSLQGEKLHSNLSRMAMVVWLFVALVITQIYTANLTSILTVQKLEASISDVDSLRNGNAAVGYCKGSFVADYLVEVLRLHRDRIKYYNSPEEYAEALRSKEISAAFIEAPYAKLFLAKYCKEFIAAGPTYKVGGFGFVFPKGSLLLHDVTKALLNVSECGRLRELEESMIASEKCAKVESIEELSSLSPSTFCVLFILTGGTSTVALLVYVVCYKRFWHNTMWGHMLAIVRTWWHWIKTFSRRISDAERTRNAF